MQGKELFLLYGLYQLAHGRTYAHGSGRIVRVNAVQFAHGFVDHTDLRAIAVRDGELVISLDQISERRCRDPDGGLLLCCVMSERFVTE